MKRSKLLLGMSMVALSGTISLGARAQTAPAARAPAATGQELGTVVVTAERRKSSVQKTALTITVVSGASVTKHGDTEMAQILQDVPGVQIQGTDGSGVQSGVGGSGGPPNIAIRGLGTDGPNKAPSTAVYLDGVLLENGGLDYYDVNRVEILSGPQGTLYGRGATGGAVSIITNDPSQKYEVFGEVQYGSYDFLGGQVVVNVPFTDQLALRVGFNGDQHNGYLKADTGTDNEYNTRAKLLYQPNDSIRALLGAEYYHAGDTLATGSFLASAAQPEPPNFTTNVLAATGGFDRDEFHKYYGQFDLDLGLTNVTYIPAYQTTHSESGYTTSAGTPAQFFQETVSPFDQTVTHELRFANAEGSKLIWVAGLYYYHNDLAQLYYIQPPGVPSPFLAYPQYPTQNSIAGFGEATYPITSYLRITGGARENEDSVKTTTGCSPGSPPGCSEVFAQRYSHFDWKARLEGDITPQNLAYLMVDTGYRPGGYVNGSTYSVEKVTAYELGSKNRFNNVTLNASAFYYDYSGFQSPESVTVNDQPVTTMLVLPAKFYGLDVEASAYLTPNDKLSLDPEVEQGTYTGNGEYGGAVVQSNGKLAPHVSNFSISGSYSHDFDLADGAVITPDADFHYQTKQITDFDVSNYPALNPEFVQNAYGLFNASLEYTSPNQKYSVIFYAKNVSNTVYKLTDANEPPAGVQSTLGDPRTLGIILQAHL